jgi:hypothetical protein
MSNFEFLIEKDISKNNLDEKINSVDRLLEGLKMFQSLYTYFIHIIGNPVFTYWYDQDSGVPYFSNCSISLGQSFSDPFAMTRCSSTRMVNNFFLFPHNLIEDQSYQQSLSSLSSQLQSLSLSDSQPFEQLKRKKSFSDISEFISDDYENIIVTQYNLSGNIMPDHTFLTIRFGQYLIIVQSFYYAYGMNSKYGIILLSSNEIDKFTELMCSYKKQVDRYNKEKKRLEIINTDESNEELLILFYNFTTEINHLNSVYQKYTGIDIKKHCAYINQIKQPNPMIDIIENIYSKEKFLENICQKLSYVLKFLVMNTNFEEIKENEDIFIIYKHFPSYNIYTLYNSFIDEVDFSRINLEFIKYTGLDFVIDIDKQSSFLGNDCEKTYDNVYNILSNEALNINILFTGLNYMFDLFNCTGLIINKYGDMLDSYTGLSWSKEFYKKILKSSKIIRNIYQKNPNLPLEKILELAEEYIKIKENFIPTIPISVSIDSHREDINTNHS